MARFGSISAAQKVLKASSTRRARSMFGVD
jgi:hypothetical protein